ncbi:MAG: phosphoribosylglycinamide formyltransferase [Phycisphaerae bacterium]
MADNTKLPYPYALGVMISGGGTTLQNLAECIARKELTAVIRCVICSNDTAYGLVRAANLGIPRYVVSRKTHPDRTAYNAAVADILRHYRVDLACMAGYLALWDIPQDFIGRVINIHPALLPKFGGKGMHGHHVHEAVLAAGERESGCTVHFCDNTYDTGPTILQCRCPVVAGDTPDLLAQRVFTQECIAYPEAIRKLQRGECKYPV